MEPVDHYVATANRLTRTQFIQKYPFMFLLKRPTRSSLATGPITFRTQTITYGEHGMINDAGPFAEGFWVWPVAKKPNNPFEGHVSIGRASNCDVVLRLSYVSKLHAHLITKGGRCLIVDHSSANGTEVNGTKLTPNTEHEVRSKDRIKLAGVELQLLDSGSFYDLLVREVKSASSAMPARPDSERAPKST